MFIHNEILFKSVLKNGKCSNIQRFCKLCNSGQIAGEFHYILECKLPCAIRKQFLHSRHRTNPNIIKCSEILSTSGAKKLRNLLTFTTKKHTSFSLTHTIIFICISYTFYVYVCFFPLFLFPCRLYMFPL
jgi:hypothetical protein